MPDGLPAGIGRGRQPEALARSAEASADGAGNPGRAGESGRLPSDCRDLIGRMLKERGPRLTVNTVVTPENLEENFRDFILRARPKGWKLLTVRSVTGRIDGFVGAFRVTREYSTGTRSGTGGWGGRGLWPCPRTMNG